MREIKMNSNNNNNLKLTETNSVIQTDDEKVKRKETTTQRKRRLEKAKQKRQEKLANETEEQKRIRLDKSKMRLKNESQEQREARLKAYRERYKIVRSQETRLQREERLLADREWHKQSRLNERKMGNEKRKETATQRKRRLEKARQYAKLKYKEKRANESLKDIEIRLIKRKTQRQNESVEKRNRRLQQIKQLNSQARSMKTSQRLEQLIQNDSVIRALEIPSKRCKRLQMSQQKSKVGASETPSQRSKRLLQMRQNISQLLNKPDLMCTLVETSPESLQYCLADLQKAMGASDGEMAMLKQLGEIKVEEHSEENWSDTNVLQLCRTTLEEQSVGNISASSSATTIPVTIIGTSLDDSSNSTTSSMHCTTKTNLHLATSDEDSSLLPDSETSKIEPNELLADHTGTEVICPTCFCHFMGFQALQLHISKCHPTIPNSKQSSALVNSLSKRAQLVSTEGSRLVCFMCQQILPTNLMSSHLVDEHSSKRCYIAKCQPIGGTVRNDDNDEEEKFKYKMSDALGDLLDRAANNLITAKQDTSNGMSDIAVQLLNNLCALKKKSTPHQRLHPSTKDMLLKVFDKYCFEAEQKKGAANGSRVGNFTCRLCGESFLWESKATWRRHVLEIHARPRAVPIVDDLSSDHKEAVATEGESPEDDLKSQLPLSDGKTEQCTTLKSTDKPTASSETKDSNTVSANNSSNSNDCDLRKGSDNSSATTSQTTTPLTSGYQSSSQSIISGPQNRRLRDNKKLRGGSTDSYKRQRLIRIKEDKSAKKRAEDALRELNLSQKVATANKISSGKPVRFRFGIEKV